MWEKHEGLSRVKIDAQLTYRQSEALKKAEAAFQSLFCTALDSNEVTEGATEETDFR
jgi:hypothetical protein